MNFKESRLPFFLKDGSVYLNEEVGDSRDCEQWAREEHDLTHEEWAACTRGYISQGRIQLFTGEDYRPVDGDAAMHNGTVEELTDIYWDFFSTDPHIYNGVRVGVPDTVWEPIEEL